MDLRRAAALALAAACWAAPAAAAPKDCRILPPNVRESAVYAGFSESRMCEAGLKPLWQGLPEGAALYAAKAFVDQMGTGVGIADLSDRLQLSYLFISHDLSVVRYIADEVMVISKGEAVEQGTREALFADPQHPYTRQLFAATPVTDVAAIRARVERRRLARAGV